MITLEKLKIYRSFKGDVDGWSRFGKKHEKEIFVSSEWYLIESLIQDIKLVERGLASQNYSKDLSMKLSSNCENEETVLELKALVHIV